MKLLSTFSNIPQTTNNRMLLAYPSMKGCHQIKDTFVKNTKKSTSDEIKDMKCIKDGEEVQRFPNEDIGKLVKLKSKNEKNFNEICNITYNPKKENNYRFNSYNEISDSIKLKKKSPKTFSKIIEKSNMDDTKNIKKLMRFCDKKQNAMKTLDESKLILEAKDSDFHYKAFEISYIDDENKRKIITIDKNNGNIIDDEEFNYLIKPDIRYSIKKDNEDNASYSIAKYSGHDIDNLISSIKTVKNNDGKVLYKEYLIQSKDVDNKYNIYREENNTKYTIGTAEKTTSGNIIVEKNLVDSIGVKTQSLNIISPNGSRLIHTKITNPDGSILLNNKQQFKVIDENHFKSIENGTEYDINYSDKNVKVTKDDGDEVNISIGENEINSNGVISKELVPLTKQLPGSIYFDIDKFNLTKIGVGLDDVDDDSAHYCTELNLVTIGEELNTPDRISTLLHELGHFKDEHKKICYDDDLIDIYEDERELFVENRPRMELEASSYFVEIEEGSTDYSLEEFVADTYLHLHSANLENGINLRGEYLQQNFPETFAKAANLLLGN